MKKIGLTGVMGAGKSSVIEILKENGIIVLDCDRINAQLLEKNEAGYTALVAAFSTIILDEHDEISKQKMSDIIFSNQENRKRAEGILHPLIKEEITRQVKQHEDQDLLVVEVPLLFEVKWESFFDEVWVVACDHHLLLERLQAFRHISKEEATRRLAHQMSQEEKISKADVVFYNNSNKENLKRQICDILKVNRR